MRITGGKPVAAAQRVDKDMRPVVGGAEQFAEPDIRKTRIDQPFIPADVFQDKIPEAVIDDCAHPAPDTELQPPLAAPR